MVLVNFHLPFKVWPKLKPTVCQEISFGINFSHNPQVCLSTTFATLTALSHYYCLKGKPETRMTLVN